jgi:hypothetical protein
VASTPTSFIGCTSIHIQPRRMAYVAAQVHDRERTFLRGLKFADLTNACLLVHDLGQQHISLFDKFCCPQFRERLQSPIHRH